MRSLVLALAASFTLAVQAVAGYEWRQFPDDSTQVSLWDNGVQVGNLRLEDAKFFKLLSPGSWSEPTPCPAGIPAAFLKVCKRQPKGKSCCECPCCGDNCTCATGKHCGKPNCNCILAEPSTVSIDGIPNYGVDSKEITKGQHQLNGREVSRKQLMHAIDSVSVPDDANLLFVTVIGPDAARKQVEDDLKANEALVKLKGQYRLQSYAPDHWAVKDAGFFTGGLPTIYFQSPDGKVLHRQDSYAGPDALAKVFTKVSGTLRDKNDSYDPTKDPDVTKVVTDWLKNLPPWAWMLGGLVVLFLLLRNPAPSK